MNKQQIIVTDSTIEKEDQFPIQIGLSACLAGKEVRFNGGHTQSRLCLDVLSKHFSFKTFCPEVAAGFSTPRPAMRLVGDPDSPKLVFSHDEVSDLTSQLVNGFKTTLSEFSSLDGYILMKNSPSCGLERVKVYQANGHPHQKRTAGLFAQALKEKYPLMPIEEEGRLHDDVLFDNFVLRVYAYNDFRQEVINKPSLHSLIAFHSRYKYLLMAHDQKKYRALGRLLGSPIKELLNKLIDTYFTIFMHTLAKPANKRNHTNTLFHILGYLKTSISSSARQSIADVIIQYKNGIIPLITPLTLLKHYLALYGSSYINTQRYLTPYPQSMHPIRKFCG